MVALLLGTQAGSRWLLSQAPGVQVLPANMTGGGSRVRIRGTSSFSLSNDPIYIIDGARTPFLKSRNRPGPFAASDLASAAGRALLVRQPFAPTELDEVILGCAAPSVDEVNIGRVAALRMGCGLKVPGWTVMRNCASGMQAIDSAINNIRAGRSNLVLAGGVDALSRVPLLFSDAMVLWLSNWYAAKTFGQRAALAAKFRLALLGRAEDPAVRRAGEDALSLLDQAVALLPVAADGSRQLDLGLATRATWGGARAGPSVRTNWLPFPLLRMVRLTAG